jgi:hypothetical protein
MLQDYSIDTDKDHRVLTLGEIFLEILTWVGPFTETTSDTKPLAGNVSEVREPMEARDELDPHQR